MRSNLAALLCLLGTGLLAPSCDGQSSRITDICVTLERCSGYVVAPSCSEAITGAINDRRLSTSAMARCAECLGDYAPPGDDNDFGSSGVKSCDLADRESFFGTCDELLAHRRCDAACSDVSYVLQVRTTARMREQMCRVADRCGGSEDSCRGNVESELQLRVWRPDQQGSLFEARLAVDAEVDQCRSCLVKPSEGEGSIRQTPAATCELLVLGCSEACRKVRSVSPILSTAKMVLDACKADDCFVAPAPDARIEAAGGSGSEAAEGDGAGGAGGAGGAADEDRETTACFDRVWSSIGSLDTASVAADPCALPAAGTGGTGPRFVDAGVAGEEARGTAGAAGESLQTQADRPSPTDQQARLERCVGCIASKECDAIGRECREICQGLGLGERR